MRALCHFVEQQSTRPSYTYYLYTIEHAGLHLFADIALMRALLLRALFRHYWVYGHQQRRKIEKLKHVDIKTQSFFPIVSDQCVHSFLPNIIRKHLVECARSHTLYVQRHLSSDHKLRVQMQLMLADGYGCECGQNSYHEIAHESAASTYFISVFEIKYLRSRIFLQ